MIKAIFFDVDGTLLPKGSHEVPFSTRIALQKLHEKGILTFIATGRHQSQLEKLPLDQMPMDGYITMEGAYCNNHDSMIYGTPLSLEDRKNIVKLVQENPFPLIFADCKEMWINMVNDHVLDVHHRLNAYIPEVSPIEKLVESDMYLMIAYCSSDQRDKLRQVMKYTKMTWWDSDSAADLVSIDAGKDHGVEAVLKHYEISKEESMAFGDGVNDLPLMEACGISIAMGNALQEVKEKANYVTDADVDDGIYNALIKYGIIEK